MLQESSDIEIVEGLSGDDLDPRDIVAGGRSSRRWGKLQFGAEAAVSRSHALACCRGRAQFGGGGPSKYSKNPQVDSDEDEW